MPPIFYSHTGQGSHYERDNYTSQYLQINRLSFKSALMDLQLNKANISPFKADVANVSANTCSPTHPADICSPIFTMKMVSNNSSGEISGS